MQTLQYTLDNGAHDFDEIFKRQSSESSFRNNKEHFNSKLTVLIPYTGCAVLQKFMMHNMLTDIYK